MRAVYDRKHVQALRQQRVRRQMSARQVLSVRARAARCGDRNKPGNGSKRGNRDDGAEVDKICCSPILVDACHE